MLLNSSNVNAIRIKLKEMSENAKKSSNQLTLVSLSTLQKIVS